MQEMPGFWEIWVSPSKRLQVKVITLPCRLYLRVSAFLCIPVDAPDWSPSRPYIYEALIQISNNFCCDVPGHPNSTFFCFFFFVAGSDQYGLQLLDPSDIPLAIFSPSEPSGRYTSWWHRWHGGVFLLLWHPKWTAGGEGRPDGRGKHLLSELGKISKVEEI